MILPNNGFIEIEQTTGGGLVNGLPQESTVSYSDKIPCHILKNEDHKGNYDDGEYKQLNFTIWLNTQEFESKRIRLTDNRNVLLGVFEVQSIEHLDLVQRVKLTV